MRVHSPTSRSGRRIYLSIWDLFWALVSPILALFLRDIDIQSNADWSMLVSYWVLSAGFAIVAFFAFRLQDGMTRYFSVHEALDIAEAVLFAELMTFAVLFTLTRLDGIPRSMPLVHGLLLAGGLLAARVFVRIVASEDNEPPDHQCRRERIILIGANRFASSFIQLLNAYAPQQQRVIAVLDEDAAMLGRAISGVQIFGAPHELEAIVSEFAIHGIGTDRIVIAGEVDFLSPPVLHEVERICKKRQIELTFLPRMIGVSERKSTNAPAVIFEPVESEQSFAMAPIFRLKRWIDIVGSLTLIVLLLPLLMLAGLLVLLDVGRPIFFWQERLGWKRRSFLIYKFRTLRAPFDSAGNPALGSRQPSTVAAIHRDASPAGIGQLLKVVCCPPSGAQSNQTALLTFEICRSEKADPSGRAVPARKKSVALYPTELASLQALEAGKIAR